MALKIDIKFSKKELEAIKGKAIKKKFEKSSKRAARKSLAVMKSDASKRVREIKRIKAKAVKKAIVPVPNTGRSLEDMNWGIRLKGDTFRVSDYPYRATKKGISVRINKGQLSKIPGAFVATMRNGHRGVFVRSTVKSLPISEPIASRPVDALLKDGEADGVAEAGRVAYFRELDRLLDVDFE